MQKVSKTELARMEDNKSVMVTKANKIVVTSVAQENNAYKVLGDVVIQLRMIEKKRTAITVPLNQSLRETNAMFKLITAPLEGAKTVINDKILEFKLEQEKIAVAKMVKKEKLQASHKARGHETHELVPEIVETGESVMQKRWTYEVMDFSMIPHQYLQLNLGVIREAINGGVRNIAGLNILQKAGLSIR